MEIKLKRMPFSIELAKKITEGKIKGAKIISHDGLDVRILAFDLKGDYPIAAAIKAEDDNEWACSISEEGCFVKGFSSFQDINLYVPTSYKDYSNFEPQKWQPVLVRNFDTDKWIARVSNGKKESNGFYMLAINGEMQFFSQCLPISKTTIKLLGTTKSYAELMEE